MKVPWANLYIDDQELEEVAKVIKSTFLSMGPKVAEFEDRMKGYTGAKHAIAVNSGTAALDAALRTLDIKPGDHIIVPAFAYIASANCVMYQNAVPIFCDVDPRTFTLDPADVEKRITPKTKCIIGVDYGGLGPDYDALKSIAEKRGIPVIEDGAPGLGGEYKGRKLCSLGTISTTSFHAAKVMSTVEGGMVFTDDDRLAHLLRMVRSQGEDPTQKYHHPVIGHNYRMTDIAAAIGCVQLRRLNDILGKRAEIAAFYTRELAGLGGLKTPYVRPGDRHAWFLYPLLLENRDRVREYLEKHGISTNVSWPMPIYDQKPYREFKKWTCPVTETLIKKILCLPMYYGMTRTEQEYVVDHVRSALAKRGTH